MTVEYQGHFQLEKAQILIMTDFDKVLHAKGQLHCCSSSEYFLRPQLRSKENSILIHGSFSILLHQYSVKCEI